MQLLTTTNVYGPGDHSNEAFLELVTNPPEGVVVLDGNAGLGADWPAGVWKSLNGAAVALAILSAPSTIEENWPVWKEIFDSIAQKVIEFHGEFRIDRDSAQVIAMHHSVAVCGIDPNSMSVHMAIRHFFTSYPGYEDLLKTDRIDMDWSGNADFGSEAFSHGVRSNEEAARQARCRYIFGINDGSSCLTVVVEQNGNVSMSAAMDMQSSWG
ncbi:hypothetical protein [Roseovarius nubinhibens]|uniref:hypothetical protein n=1 Tax=Roseovarius nubinhibens TaxID=314263 RepID=UPI0012EA21D3|nr:hypothetical protein [Roseovarius nubinhibens]